MLKEERYEYIMRKLEKDRKVTLGDLSAELNISEDTVRRDIEALASSQRLVRVRGGAIPHSPNTNVHSFKERVHLSEEEKAIIAIKALSLVEPGSTILLDGGTTTYAMARLLPKDMPLRVVTNCIPIADVLMDHPLVEMVFAGGHVFKSSQVTVGMEAIQFLSRLRVDVCFTGVCSLHPEFGISAPDLAETEVKRAMVGAANRVVVVTTANKMGTAEAFKVCDITEVGTIVTETDPGLPLFQPYRDLGIAIL